MPDSIMRYPFIYKCTNVVKRTSFFIIYFKGSASLRVLPISVLIKLYLYSRNSSSCMSKTTARKR